jgi:hypothetical protein
LSESIQANWYGFTVEISILRGDATVDKNLDALDIIKVERMETGQIRCIPFLNNLTECLVKNYCKAFCE